MSIDWYVFEESYLIGIDHKICDSTIIIKLDAKISNQHPKVSKTKSYEDTFEEVQILFNGVQYYRGINSANILNDPNDDIGSVYSLQIGNNNSVEDGIRVEYKDSLMKISMDNNNEVISEIFSQSKNIKFVEFVSEMISFRAAFTDYEIKVNDENAMK